MHGPVRPKQASLSSSPFDAGAFEETDVSDVASDLLRRIEGSTAGAGSKCVLPFCFFANVTGDIPLLVPWEEGLRP